MTGPLNRRSYTCNQVSGSFPNRARSTAPFRGAGKFHFVFDSSGPRLGCKLGCVKRLLARENFFFSTYTTSDGRPGEVGLAPTHQGELMVIDVEPATQWLCAGGSYLGSTAGLNVNTQFQGMKGFVTGESLVFLEVSGSGQLLVNAFGRLVESEVDQSVTVDTGHLVAFESTLRYEITKAGKSWIQSWLAGEGVVMKFTGQGRIITQSHNPRGFGATLGRLLPPRK